MAKGSITAKANTGSGTETLVTDNIGADIYPVTKLVLGDYGADDDPVSAANPLPVTGTVELSGSVTVGAAKAEDAAHSSGDTGNFILAVRRDSATALAGTEGDYSAFAVDQYGQSRSVPGMQIESAYTQAGVIAINTILLTIDCLDRASVSIQCSSMGTTGVVTPEWSNNNSTWVTATIFTQAGASATTFNAAGLWVTPVLARYLRLRLSTATTAGTTTLTVQALSVVLGRFLATVPTTISSGTVTTLTNITNWGNVADNAAFTDGTTRLSMSGYIFDETAGTALTENDAAAARVTANRAQVMTIEDYATRARGITVKAASTAAAASDTAMVVAVSPNNGVGVVALSAGGATFSKIRSAASTNATNLKASAGRVVSIFLQNNGTVQQFFKLHNVSSTPTAGASVALTFVVNPGDTLKWDGGDQGMAFGTGIGYTITSGQAESDTGAATADAVLGLVTWV